MSSKAVARLRRKTRVRSHVSGSAERPRVSVFRSNRGLSVQVIDDTVGKTLFSTSTLLVKGAKNNKDSAASLGKEFGSKLKEKGIEKVVFDRNGYKYHGKIQVFAEALRESGLTF